VNCDVGNGRKGSDSVTMVVVGCMKCHDHESYWLLHGSV
jgi:hypothetical protein